MEKRELCGHQVSLLGFGAMRLPINEDGSVDREKGKAMVDFAYQNGVNYFDTAYVYHQGESEEFLGEVLGKYPRESFFLADKTPGHVINPNYSPIEAFERSLKRCQTDYFDFYLLHNVMESSLKTYTDPNLRVMDYLLEQKAKGRIRHIGISTHGQFEMMKDFLDRFEGDIEFVQIQLNYLDWILQEGQRKYELLEERGMPIIVMEPCRGGKLATVPLSIQGEMKKLRQEDSAVAWAFGFLGSLPKVSTILSGMSTLEQVMENVKTFDRFQPLSEKENQFLLEIGKSMMDAVPCTGCGYCLDGCPQNIQIPVAMKLYNEAKYDTSMMIGMAINAMEEGTQPKDCIGCQACSRVCPQKINIPEALQGLSEKVRKGPDWKKISEQRLKADRK